MGGRNHEPWDPDFANWSLKKTLKVVAGVIAAWFIFIEAIFGWRAHVLPGLLGDAKSRMFAAYQNPASASKAAQTQLEDLTRLYGPPRHVRLIRYWADVYPQPLMLQFAVKRNGIDCIEIAGTMNGQVFQVDEREQGHEARLFLKAEEKDLKTLNP